MSDNNPGIAEYASVQSGEIIRSKLFMNNKSFQITIPKDIIEQYQLKKEDMIKLQVIGILRKPDNDKNIIKRGKQKIIMST